jgi:hypothetical protein
MLRFSLWRDFLSRFTMRRRPPLCPVMAHCTNYKSTTRQWLSRSWLYTEAEPSSVRAAVLLCADQRSFALAFVPFARSLGLVAGCAPGGTGGRPAVRSRQVLPSVS